MFVAPALYKRERSAVTGFVFSTVILFVAESRSDSFCAAPHPGISGGIPGAGHRR